MSVEQMAQALNKLIEMVARSQGCDSSEIDALEIDLWLLVNGVVPVEDFFWVLQMLGE